MCESMTDPVQNLTSSVHDGAYLAHKEGAGALLQLRSIEEFYADPISARLFEVTYMQMVSGFVRTYGAC